MQAYCDRHGYEFAPSHAPSKLRHASWEKVLLLIAECDKPEDCRAEFAVWYDDDIAITRPEMSLLRVLRDAFRDPRTMIVTSADVLPNYPINAGVLACRCTRRAGDFLLALWEYSDPRLHWHHGLEQDALTRWYMGPGGQAAPNTIKILPHTVLQSFSGALKPETPSALQWAPGHFAIHVTPGTEEERVAELRRVLGTCCDAKGVTP
jgi:hypothetical protein